MSHDNAMQWQTMSDAEWTADMDATPGGQTLSDTLVYLARFRSELCTREP